MIPDYQTVNWRPSYSEFIEAVKQNRVTLNPGDHIGVLTEDVLSLLPFNFFRYTKRCIRKMAIDRTAFERVFDSGVDIVLLKKGDTAFK